MTTQQQLLTDQTLVQLFLQGKDEAIAELIYRYKDNVYTSIYMMVKDKYTAEDLFQDTFLKIVTNIRAGRYSEQGKFLPWALRIAHNLCIDYFRKVKQQVKITLPDGSDIFSLISPSSYDNAETRMIRMQTESCVEQLIRLLPIEQREVLVMRIYGEMSFKEIAQLTGVSINTSLGRMRYALINLRKIIEEKKVALR
jgi:RNA polymerase sigma factor (sigma-70 family)